MFWCNGEVRIYSLIRKLSFNTHFRNGGHCSPNTFEDYLELRDTLGLAAATQIIQFRLAHISALINVATEEALLADCQARDVEEYNVYANKQLFESAKDLLEKYLKDVPEEGKRYEIYETREEIEVCLALPSL